MSGRFKAVNAENLHIVRIPSYCERETAVDFGNCRFEIWALQRAAGQHRFLRVVEGDSTKLFPVADKVILNYNLMDG